MKLFIFEAGIKYFSEFSSKTIFPVSSETIFTPTCPRRSSGRASPTRIVDCRSKEFEPERASAQRRRRRRSGRQGRRGSEFVLASWAFFGVGVGFAILRRASFPAPEAVTKLKPNPNRASEKTENPEIFSCFFHFHLIAFSRKSFVIFAFCVKRKKKGCRKFSTAFFQIHKK